MVPRMVWVSRHSGKQSLFRHRRSGFCWQRSRSLASTDLVHDASAPPLHHLVVPGRQLTVGALK